MRKCVHKFFNRIFGDPKIEKMWKSMKKREIFQNFKISNFVPKHPSGIWECFESVWNTPNWFFWFGPTSGRFSLVLLSSETTHSWIFAKFIQLSWALSPSSRGVGSSDYVRCKGLNVIFKKNQKFRKNLFSKQKLWSNKYHSKTENPQSHPH